MNNNKYFSKSFIAKQKRKNDRIFGPKREHIKLCIECANKYTWFGRKNTKSYQNSKFCSKSCANKQGPKRRNYKYNYVKICFKFHERRCIICGEDLAVEVHHYDWNNSNNLPYNLIPLCPTHHQYLLSDNKYVIKECVDEYYFRQYGEWDCMGWSSRLHRENQRGSIPLLSTTILKGQSCSMTIARSITDLGSSEENVNTWTEK